MREGCKVPPAPSSRREEGAPTLTPAHLQLERNEKGMETKKKTKRCFWEKSRSTRNAFRQNSTRTVPWRKRPPGALFALPDEPDVKINFPGQEMPVKVPSQCDAFKLSGA